MHPQEEDQAQSSDPGEVITPPLEEDGAQRARRGRGRGIANELKIRERKWEMEEQQRRESATAAAAALFQNPPSSSLSPTQYHPSQQPPIVLRSNNNLSQQPPLVLRSNNNNNNLSSPPISLPPSPPVYFPTMLLESNHLFPSSNESTQQYQQPFSSKVNVSPGNITSPVYHPYNSTDPTSNQNYSSSKRVPPRLKDEMTKIKRSYDSSQDVPPASYFNFKSPAVTTNTGANKSTSYAYQTGQISGAAPSSSRRVPSCPTSKPRSTSTVSAIHNQQELPHPEPPPFHVRQKESNHPCPFSNQSTQQYQQPSSSNMTEMKRSYASSQDVPPASCFNFKSPAVATNVRANNSTSSRAYETGQNSGAAPSSPRRVPSCPTSTPRSTSTVSAIHNQQELPHPKPPPFQNLIIQFLSGSEEDQIPH